MGDITKDFVHLARLALEHRTEDISMMVKKNLPSIMKKRPDLSPDILGILNVLSRSASTRAIAEPLPVDADSRLELLRRDYEPKPEIEPIWPASVDSALSEIVLERGLGERLKEIGVEPTKSTLFVGKPGTGKSLAARWLAYRLHYPLLTLDLSAVMSSFLGKTGNNIRVVLDYAKQSQSILLLDEFDAIAKRRDDVAEIGELKRLVTVLLQEIESWPSSGLLVAATNHPDLLDPAVWRRFDRVIEFVLPNREEIHQLLRNMLPDVDDRFLVVLSGLLEGGSFSDVTKMVATAKRMSLVRNVALTDAILDISAGTFKTKSTKEKLTLAALMKSQGISQRQISSATGMSRDTLRSHLRGTNGKDTISDNGG